MSKDNLLTLVDIQASIGYKITADFIERDLGIEAHTSDRRAKFFTYDQYNDIRRELCVYVTKRTHIIKGDRPAPKSGNAPAPSPKPSPHTSGASAAVTYDDPDDF